MSADNGIYVLKTRTPGDKVVKTALCEYRVAHLQGIDNLYYDVATGEHKLDFTPEEAYIYFKECQVIYDGSQALEYAHRLADQQTILEYGVVMLRHENQLFEEFTNEQLASYNAKIDDLIEEHRNQRNEELESKRETARRGLSPEDNFHPTQVAGFIAGPNGERVYGRLILTEEEFEKVKIGYFEGLDFLPNDWNK